MSSPIHGTEAAILQTATRPTKSGWALCTISIFAVAWVNNDPRSVGSLVVSVSTDGVHFTTLNGTQSVKPSGETADAEATTLTVQPVDAQYVLYDFGPPFGVANGGEQVGSAFYSVSADGTLPGSPVPEASTWAMLLLGFAGIGLAGVFASRNSGTASA